MTGKLAGKIAVVTGGSAGIGLGMAKHFAQEGARVFIIGRRQSQLDQAVAAIGGDAAALQGDISNLADLNRIYATVEARAGRIDVLAVDAGVYEFATLGEITEEQFDRTFNTDVRGLLFTVQKALPLLTRGSSVILTGSMVSIKGFASCSVYNAAKAAVRSFARTWIVDLKGRDIRINVLSPKRKPRWLRRFRSAGWAPRTISARQRYFSLPTTVPTSPVLSCSSMVARLRSECVTENEPVITNHLSSPPRKAGVQSQRSDFGPLASRLRGNDGRCVGTIGIFGQALKASGRVHCGATDPSRRASHKKNTLWSVVCMIRNFSDDVPLTHFYSWTLPPGLPPRWAQTHLELFASKVIPAFR